MKPTFITVLKKSVFFSICFSFHSVFAQNVGINATGAKADGSAMLDISAANKGLLVPRIPFLTGINDAVTIKEPAHSLLIYTKIEGPNGQEEGYYYNSGDEILPVWVRLSTTVPNPTSGWLLEGNAGTNPGVNFLGTIDNQEIIFRQNNEKIGGGYTRAAH
ncbi:MAG: hypothetical protein IPJ81_17615 [Chitinophagaceae bacterium]|nr:hypothetical protein [Chitinophagaceae bacterium]